MTPQKRTLLELRALRDAARKVVSADVAYVRSDAAKRGWAKSAAMAGVDYLKLVGEGALDLARENRGRVAGGVALTVAALAAWAFRDQIADALAGSPSDASEDADQPEPEPVSETP